MAQGDEAAGDGACVGPEAILRKPEAADSGTSMEPEAIISKPEAAGSGACVEPEAILRKPEAAHSATSMEPEAIISKPEAAGSGACVEPEQAKNNPKPSPLLGPFCHTDFLAENGFFFVGLLRARRAAAAAQFLAVRSLLWRSCWCQSGLKASCCLPASSRRCREHTLTTAVREVAKLRPYLVQLFAPRFWLSY